MRWLMRLVRRDRFEQELDAELRFHVDEETRRLTRQGVPSAEARRRALAAFGGLEPMQGVRARRAPHGLDRGR